MCVFVVSFIIVILNFPLAEDRMQGGAEKKEGFGDGLMVKRKL